MYLPLHLLLLLIPPTLALPTISLPQNTTSPPILPRSTTASFTLSLYPDTPDCSNQPPFSNHAVQYNTPYNTADSPTGKNAKKALPIQGYLLSGGLSAGEELDLFSDAGCTKGKRRVDGRGKGKGCHGVPGGSGGVLCVKVVVG
ncbi:hypothetical protein ACLMJK_008491 [Lecanora helva]